MVDDEDLEEAEVDRESDEDEAIDDDEGRASVRKQGKKKMLMLIGVFLLLLSGAGGAAYFTGLTDALVGKFVGEDEELKIAIASVDTAYYDLPEILVNMGSPEPGAPILKVRISLELESEDDIDRVQQVMPRIVDRFNVYLRELRVQELKGSQGLHRLRRELLARLAGVTAPVTVSDVLFKEVLVEQGRGSTKK